MDVTATFSLFQRRHIMKRLSVPLAALAILCLSSLASAQNPSSAVLRVTDISFSPEAPRVGTNYTVTATVSSRQDRPVVVRCRIQLPRGDSLVAGPGDIQIAANGTATFRWTVFCGVNGGTVSVVADPIREVR
jgi:hypothetical protein